LESLDLQKNNLTDLPLFVFNQLRHLKYLFLDFNNIVSLDNDIFYGLKNLKNLSISNNKLKLISNTTFIHLFNLNYLNLASNKIDDESNLTILFNLTVLDLSSNLIKKIKKHDFDGFKNIKMLYLESNQLERIEPGSLDLFGSVVLKLSISMPNISNENIYSIKDSLKPQMVRTFFHINYFAPTHIENRVDVDCVKTLYFMRFKILYNFFNEHIDINDFTTNCMNLSIVRHKLNYLEYSSNHFDEEIKSSIKIQLNDSSKIFIIYSFISASITISIIYSFYYYFLKQFKTKNSQNEQNNAESIELSLDLKVISPDAINSQSFFVSNANKKVNSPIIANLTIHTMIMNRLLRKLKRKQDLNNTNESES
jgi:Leucine-rich repeat (LRR) protein